MNPVEPLLSAGDAGFATRLVRAGAVPDPTTGALLVPVHQNTTYLQTCSFFYQNFNHYFVFITSHFNITVAINRQSFLDVSSL